MNRYNTRVQMVSFIQPLKCRMNVMYLYALSRLASVEFAWRLEWVDKTAATVLGYVGLSDRELPRCRNKNQLCMSQHIFSKDHRLYVCICVCMWMCHWPNGRVASSDRARWWEYNRNVYMTCRIIQYRKNLMDCRVLCWRLVTMTIRHG